MIRKSREIISELGRRISQESGDHRESAFIFQRLSITVQRFNAVAVQGTFTIHTPPEDDVPAICFYIFQPSF